MKGDRGRPRGSTTRPPIKPIHMRRVAQTLANDPTDIENAKALAVLVSSFPTLVDMPHVGD